MEGFATAGEAEKKGLEIAFGILWGAISENYSVRLQYQTPLPCVVYDRSRQGSGAFLTASATVIFGKPLASITNAIDEGLSSKESGNEKLMLAMELFASARQESTERSRFIGLVSSLEPLAEQQVFTPEISTVIDHFKGQIKDLKLPSRIEASLLGQTEGLYTESVSSAIRRLINETLPDDSKALHVIEDAYNLRSRILHDGTTDADLNQKSREVEAVVRQVIASRAALRLRVP
ncbi:MAG: HEPN domain-containing protein [Proteobacteria bacterium]|nr:HEPN domain-containing protein [Pseudomonadota bacterium]